VFGGPFGKLDARGKGNEKEEENYETIH